MYAYYGVQYVRARVRAREFRVNVAIVKWLWWFTISVGAPFYTAAHLTLFVLCRGLGLGLLSIKPTRYW